MPGRADPSSGAARIGHPDGERSTGVAACAILPPTGARLRSTWVNRTAHRLRGLLFSSRPAWAMMPGPVAANFADNLLFLLSALELTGVVYVAHFGTLLGSVRLGGVSPWDEDADIYVIGEDRASLERKLRRVLTEHGFLLIWDERGFYWVRQDPWWAGQG